MDKPANLIIPTDLVQQVANYMQTKPWAEVNGFLVAFQELAPAPDEQKPAPDDSPKDISSPELVPTEKPG